MKTRAQQDCNMAADLHINRCGACGVAGGHIYECRHRPKGTAPVEQLDWGLIWGADCHVFKLQQC